MKARHVRNVLLLFALINLLLVGIGQTRRQPALLRVTFLDVGQGDAAVVESPSGRTLVVDTGGTLEEERDDEGRRIVAPFLQHEGINHIDAIALTHPHADHIGGAATLLERFDVGMLLDNGAKDDSPLVTRYLTAARARGVVCKAARRGQTLDFGDGVTARILSPTDSETQGPANDASIVLRIDYGRTSFLLTGDAEQVEEADLVSTGQPLACDVLKVGHHGSETSTTPPFLAAAHPRLAVISVGAHNLYGHPNRDVLDRLHTMVARVYRTDRNGAVTCTSDGVSIHAEAMRTDTAH